MNASSWEERGSWFDWHLAKGKYDLLTPGFVLYLHFGKWRMQANQTQKETKTMKKEED